MVQYVSELPLDPKIQAVKVERRKSKSASKDFLTQIDVLFILSFLTVRERNVPHFKGLIISDLSPRAQGRDSTFTFCHALLI